VVEKKVAVPTVLAAVVTIIVWAVNEFTDVTIPAEVSAAILTVVVASTGYLTPHTPRKEAAEAPAPTEPPAGEASAA
jgi:hypothetical protein